MDVIDQVVYGANDLELDWTPVMLGIPQLRMLAFEDAHARMAAFLAAAERIVTAHWRIEVDCIDLSRVEVPEDAGALVPAATAQAWIEAARANQALLGHWSATASPGRSAWLSNADEYPLVVGFAPQIATSAWQLDTELGWARSGSHFLAQIAPLTGGYRLQLGLEHRLASGGGRLRNVTFDGLLVAGESTSVERSLTAEVQDQPIQTLGFLLNIDLPRDNAALVRASWASNDGLLGGAKRLYIIRASGGVEGGVHRIDLGDRQLLLVAPGSLQSQRWPEPQYEAGGSPNLANSHGADSQLGFVELNAPDPADALERVGPFGCSYLAGWVVGIAHRESLESEDYREFTLPRSEGLTPCGLLRLDLSPFQNQNLQLGLPVGAGRGALAYLTGTELVHRDSESEVAGGSAVSYWKVATQCRGVILQVEVQRDGSGLARPLGQLVGAWPLPQTPKLSNELHFGQVDQLALRRFHWNLEEATQALQGGLRFGADLPGQASGLLQIGF
jgi:hypothetical protein